MSEQRRRARAESSAAVLGRRSWKRIRSTLVIASATQVRAAALRS